MEDKKNLGDGPTVPPNTPLCTYCGKEFRQRKSLYEHIRNVHKKNTDNMLLVSKNLLRCPICSQLESSRQKIYEHLAAVHDYIVNFERKIFNNLHEFKQWKEQVERDSVSQYVLKRGVKRLANASRKLYYHCSRSGDYGRVRGAKSNNQQDDTVNPNNNRIRRMKSQGTRKIGKLCTATMEVQIFPNNWVEVSFWSTHTGHTFDLEHCNLSNGERTAIMEKLEQGVTFDRILDDVQESITSDPEKISRVHLLTKKDLNNLQNKISQNSSMKDKQNQNDDPGVVIWVESESESEMIHLGSDSPEFDFSVTEHNLDEDINKLFDCGVNQNIPKNTSALQDEMKEKTERLLELCSENYFDDETCTSAIKYLDLAREVLTSSLVPSNS